MQYLVNSVPFIRIKFHFLQLYLNALSIEKKQKANGSNDLVAQFAKDNSHISFKLESYRLKKNSLCNVVQYTKKSQMLMAGTLNQDIFGVKQQQNPAPESHSLPEKNILSEHLRKVFYNDTEQDL